MGQPAHRVLARCVAQVDFLKLLYDKLLALHLRHAGSPDEHRLPRPSFKVCVDSTRSARQPAPVPITLRR